MATMVAEKIEGNLKRQLEKLFDTSLKLIVPDEPGVEPLVKASTARNKKFGDYQCTTAMRICSTRKKPKDAPALGQDLLNKLPTSEMVESCSVTGHGFINAVLSAEWMAKSIENMLPFG